MAQGYAGGSGLVLPLAIDQGGTGTTGSAMLDENGNIIMSYFPVANSVNYVESVNAPTGLTPGLVAKGDDTNIVLTLAGQGNAGVGIYGTSTNSTPLVGTVGEYISASTLIGSAVSLTTATNANIATISLTAGDWDVSGTIYFSANAATTSSYYQAGISATSATFGTVAAENNNNFFSVSLAAGSALSLAAGRTRINLASTTTIYLIARSVFLINTMSAYGFIGARRVR